MPTAHLHPYFSFGDPSSPFFFYPWQDVGNCLRNLLLHQLASHQVLGRDITLSSHDVDLFLATGPNFPESEVASLRISKEFYILRCHYDKPQERLIFGVHRRHGDFNDIFHALEVVSLRDDPNWRLPTCRILKNLARILLCLKDYAIPLVVRPEKLSIVPSMTREDQVSHNNSNHYQQRERIQKIYDGDYICNIFNATVPNMIDIYRKMDKAKVPHTDQIVSVVEEQGVIITKDEREGKRRICQFAPIGRSYLPEVRSNCSHKNRNSMIPSFLIHLSFQLPFEIRFGLYVSEFQRTS
jgi:hypothetical protein